MSKRYLLSITVCYIAHIRHGNVYCNIEAPVTEEKIRGLCEDIKMQENATGEIDSVIVNSIVCLDDL